MTQSRSRKCLTKKESGDLPRPLVPADHPHKLGGTAWSSLHAVGAILTVYDVSQECVFSL